MLKVFLVIILIKSSKFCSINLRLLKVKKCVIGVLGAGVQVRKRIYNSVMNEKIRKMMEIRYQERSDAKI